MCFVNLGFLILITRADLIAVDALLYYRFLHFLPGSIQSPSHPSSLNASNRFYAYVLFILEKPRIKMFLIVTKD